MGGEKNKGMIFWMITIVLKIGSNQFKCTENYLFASGCRKKGDGVSQGGMIGIGLIKKEIGVAFCFVLIGAKG